jgi:GAF domain-containing protein
MTETTRLWLLSRIDRRCREAVISGERVIGGVAVVRYGVTQPFTDEDEALVIEVARRIAPALELQRIAHVDLEPQEP